MIHNKREGNNCFRRETVAKEEEAKRTWKANYDPWLTDAYREVRGMVFFCHISKAIN